jgi:tripartite-type tricarboxylate transporter receptor subunit TctC
MKVAIRSLMRATATLTLAAMLAGTGADRAAAQAAPNFDAASYFKGKTIELIIPLRAGGTVDLVARYFASEFPKFLPGEPRILARNVTPRIAGANFVSKSKPDGLTFGLVSTVLYQDQFHPSATFDVAKFRYIGSTNSVSGPLFVRGDLPYKDIVAAKDGKTPIRVITMPDPASVTGFDFAPLLLAEAFNLPLQAIPVSDTALQVQLLMLERGEIDGISRGIVYYHLPHIRPGWIAKNTVKPFAFFGMPGVKMWQANEEAPPVPNVTDLIEDPKLKEAWEATVLSNLALWVPFYLPPETPQPIVEVYRKAFKAAMDDPAFRKGYEAIDGVAAQPVSGEEAQKMVERFGALAESFRPKYEPLVKELYKKYTDAYKNRQK